MHSRAALLALVLLPACSGSESSPTELHSVFASGCSLTLNAGKAIPLAPVTNSTGSATFIAKNANCASNSSWSVSASRTGAVATITGVSPGGFVLAKGASKTVTVTFTTGSTAGQGSVKLNASVDAPAADLSATVPVTVGTTGIPFGLFGLPPTSIAANALWTGGTLSLEPVNQILTQLAAAQNHSPRIRMWIIFTGGDEQRFKDPTTGDFRLDRWKDTLDFYAKPFNADGSSQFIDDLQPYLQPGGSLLGNQLLDDIGNFAHQLTFAQLEAMAAHAKLRYPGITTSVRQRPSKLPTGTYASLDAAWAQYEQNPFLSDNHTAGQYRDDQIAQARARHLGLVLGLNIHDNGQTPSGDISSADLLSWGDSLLAVGTSDYGCSFMMWNKDYANLSDPNFSALATLAKNHVASPCKFH